jgi:hypothetical protein
MAREKEQPVRVTRVVVVADSEEKIAKGVRSIEGASNVIIEPQTGIRFIVVKTLYIKKGFGSDRLKAVNKLFNVLWSNGLTIGKDYDVAVGIGEYTLFENIIKFGFVPVPIWEGIIDDDCRCYIVLRSLDLRTTAHELMHVYMPHHDIIGLMDGVTLELIPGVPILGNSIYLSERARAIIVKNKWREFKLPAEIKLPPALVISSKKH